METSEAQVHSVLHNHPGCVWMFRVLSPFSSLKFHLILLCFVCLMTQKNMMMTANNNPVVVGKILIIKGQQWRWLVMFPAYGISLSDSPREVTWIISSYVVTNGCLMAIFAQLKVGWRRRRRTWKIHFKRYWNFSSPMFHARDLLNSMIKASLFLARPSRRAPRSPINFCGFWNIWTRL